MEMNPSMAECETEMNVPDGTENSESKFIPPVDVTDQKFIDLAKKMKKLQPETLHMIQRDLQPEDRKYEDEKNPKPAQEDVEVKGVKIEAKEMTPAELLT